MSIETPDIYARIYATHGHRCPMSTLGGRIGFAALQRLGQFNPVEHPLTYHARTCAVDGIAMVLSCLEADIQILNTGRHLLEVRLPGYCLKIEIAPATMQLAAGYRQLANRLETGWESFAVTEQLRRRAELDAALDKLLPQIWNAAEAELLLVTEEADA